jgi:hypothetical protein
MTNLIRSFSKEAVRKKTFSILGGLALTLSALPFTCGPVQAETKDIKIPKSVVTSAMNAYLAGVRLQIDNWGSFKSSGGGSWYTENSYLQLPSGKKAPLTVPRSPTVKTALRRFNAYIDDFSTQSISVVADGDKMMMRAFFEDAGNEIHVGCINRRKDRPCKVHWLKHTGDIDNAHVYAWFKPSFSGSTITVSPVDLTLDFDLKLDSWILNNVKNVASHYVDIKGKVRNEAKSSFLAYFKNDSVKKAMSQDVNAVLSSKLQTLLKKKLGASAAGFIRNKVKITRIRSKGSNYVVTVKYPDIVHGKSVKIVSFKPKSAKLTAGCPFKYGFDAAIRTGTKVSGTTWIDFGHGKHSAKRKWKMPKAGKAKSTITRKIKGKPGRKTSGKARLVVRWKGTTGKVYTIKSKPVKYKAICSKAAGSLKLQ